VGHFQLQALYFPNTKICRRDKKTIADKLKFRGMRIAPLPLPSHEATVDVRESRQTLTSSIDNFINNFNKSK